MALEQQIADLVTETNGLTQEVRDVLQNIEDRVVLAEGQVQQFVQDGAANFPASPNLLADTKRFTQLCGGALNTILPWNAGGLAGPWSGFLHQGSQVTLDVEVVDIEDDARLTALGLLPLGDLQLLSRPLITSPPNPDPHWGQDTAVAVFDCTITTLGTNPEDIQFVFLHNGAEEWVSWELGDFKTQTSVFVNVLSATNGVEVGLFRSMAGIIPSLGAAQVGQGWKHYHASQLGFGGHNDSVIRSTTQQLGSIKFAVALPYQGLGDHQGIPLWFGHAGGAWTHNDNV